MASRHAARVSGRSVAGTITLSVGASKVAPP